MPNSTNTWEYIYDMPTLSAAEKKEIIAQPWSVTSDTFFIADEVLVVHNRAEYNYANTAEEDDEFEEF